MGSQKSVVLITVDSLRRDSLLGDGPPDTPTLDSVREQSTECTHAYAGGPSTRSSMPGILTGTHAWSHSGHRYHSLRGRPHLAEVLSDAGYATGAFHSNEFLMSDTGFERGFDEYFEYQQGFQQYTYFQDTGRPEVDPPMRGDELNRVAVNWLASADEPLFCWVHYMDVHAPYRPHAYTCSHDVTHRRSEYLSQKVMQSGELNDAERADLRTLYRGEVEFVDSCIRSLLRWLSDHLAPEETAVAVTADHGELLGEYGEYSHPEHLYDELLRVPLYVRGPGSEPDRVDAPTSTLDLVPTLLQYAEAEVPPECRGTPVGTAADSRVVFAHAGTFTDGRAMATDGEVKLVRERDGGEETFRRDGAEVPAESVENAGALRAAMDDHLESVRESRRVGRDEDPETTMVVDDSEAFRRRLEALGYRKS